MAEGIRGAVVVFFYAYETCPCHQVTFAGDVEDSNWTLNMPPNGSRRFTDGMQVPPRGPASASRAAVSDMSDFPLWGGLVMAVF